MSNDEVNLFPELFGTLELGTDGKRWHVLHTKSRCEKKLAKWAHQNGIEYYLPLVDSFRVYSNKKAHYLKVLISSYFFAKCTSKEKEILVHGGYVANSLTVSNQAELVRDLNRIYDVRSVDIPMEEVPYVEEGYLVEITSGPLIGLIGIVEDVIAPQRIIISVEVIKKWVSVAVTPSQFKIIKDYRRY